VSCSNYEHGYFSAYRHLADENPEFVLYLGDYIYERIDEKRPTVRVMSSQNHAMKTNTARTSIRKFR
jgi:phosphodiesterase/alkaline phosphatase D-like protein